MQSATIWLHLARASVASYILYFAAMGVGCAVGLFGCWGMSSTKLIATSISLLFAFVFGVSGMGLFHAAHFYEVNKVIFKNFQFQIILGLNLYCFTGVRSVHEVLSNLAGSSETQHGL